MAMMNIVEAINDALRIELERDQNVLLFGQDIGLNGGVFRVTEGLQATFGSDRVVDTPLAEAAIVGAGIGMAARGLRPVVEIQFFGFIYEAMDQVASHMARLRFRSAGRFHAPLVIRTPYGGGVRTPELHSDSLEALFLHTPGLKVIMPSSPYDAKGLLLSAIRCNDPVLFLEPMDLYRAFKEEVPTEDYTIEIGKANVISEGEDATVITWGSPTPLVKKVVETYEEENGITIDLIDLRTIAPMDEDAIIQSVKKTGRVLIVHEAVKSGGVGAEIIALINEKALFWLETSVERVTGFDTPYPVPMVEDDWIPNEKRITEGIDKLFSE